jgi:acetyl-CoA carboxylase biotin carboxyl carrier protein
MAANKLDSNLISALANLLHKNNLTEIEYDADGIRVKVACNPNSPCNMTYGTPSVIAEEPYKAAEVKASDKEKSNEEIIKSPMVGMIYLSPEPSAKPYVSVGDEVKKGQVLFLIEAMKTFNPVKATKAGTVTEIFVKDSELVEYDEPLLSLK